MQYDGCDEGEPDPDDEADRVDGANEALGVREAHTGAAELEAVGRVDGEEDKSGVDARGGHIEDE